MITINNIKKFTADNEASIYELCGLSTDNKPTNVGVNSIFLELDTGDFYYLDDDETWKKVGA